MPTPKQMEKLANERCRPRKRAAGANARPRPRDAAGILRLDDPRADTGSRPLGPSIRPQRLAEIQQHMLRVGCRRCGRTVEIQKADAVRLAGAQAGGKDLGQRLLDDKARRPAA